MANALDHPTALSPAARWLGASAARAGPGDPLDYSRPDSRPPWRPRGRGLGPHERREAVPGRLWHRNSGTGQSLGGCQPQPRARQHGLGPDPRPSAGHQVLLQACGSRSRPAAVRRAFLQDVASSSGLPGRRAQPQGALQLQLRIRLREQPVSRSGPSCVCHDARSAQGQGALCDPERGLAV